MSTPNRYTFAGLVIDAARQVYGVEPAVRPTGDASGRQGVWLGGRLGGIPAARRGAHRRRCHATLRATTNRSAILNRRA